VTYEPEGVAAATFLLAPLVLALTGLRISGRGHWAAPVLAAPAIVLGLALLAALFRNATGPGVLGALLYAPLLLTSSLIAIIRWRRKRRSQKFNATGDGPHH